jgi:hypothetical protein
MSITFIASAGTQLRQWISATRSKENAQPEPWFHDVERMTRDIDAAMADMRLLIRPNAGPDSLMPVRLELLGLDPGYLRATRPETYAALQLTCATCPSWRACARDLAHDNAARGLGSYCLNAARIDALIIER